ncbi:LOW QUALITY PROTEIN: monothiol glutaredoxin-S3-like [Phalaenopsis equestris]|uniref:LOW QUALITY PROTEIN: monothiol glutaredoxin-S3-like n=1 Tax=Phalaenopsis equestris TaxID=78828 RepID=UPI0009E5EAED|nr:LOW QUALITY PROTEIN: monothiol glutaredoxin-S3-like [Phalaenopsis equestris]
MQKTLPYTPAKRRVPPPSPAAGAPQSPATPAADFKAGMLSKAVAENPVVVLGMRGCCMVHVVRRLLQGQGVNPTVCEVGDDEEAAAVAGQIADGGGGGGWGGGPAEDPLPAVFSGGSLVGGLDRLMAVHISGELVPILRDAGALWL